MAATLVPAGLAFWMACPWRPLAPGAPWDGRPHQSHRPHCVGAFPREPSLSTGAALAPACRVPVAELPEGRKPVEPEGAGAMALLTLHLTGCDFLSLRILTCKPRQGPHSHGKPVLPRCQSRHSLCPERFRACGRQLRPAGSAAQRKHSEILIGATGSIRTFAAAQRLLGMSGRGFGRHAAGWVGGCGAAGEELSRGQGW